MLYLKAANTDDIEAEHRFVAAIPPDENGFQNAFSGISLEEFRADALPQMISWSQGRNLPQGFVPETFYFLWDDGRRAGTGTGAELQHSPFIVGEMRLRHHLCPALERGSGHVGQFIQKEFRGRGYCTEGLRLLIEQARSIVPEKELYLHCNLDNPASLRVMLKNGGIIHHKNGDGYFVRIKL